METITEVRTHTRPCSCGEFVSLFLTPDRFLPVTEPPPHPEWALVDCPKCRLPVPFRLPDDLTQRPEPRKSGGLMAAAMEAGLMRSQA